MSVTERFLRYVRYDTASSEESTLTPSTEGQRVLLALLAEEMRGLGMERVRMDEYGYVYGFLPATGKDAALETMGLIAHADTSPAVSGANVSPRTLLYGGGAIPLENGDVIDPKVYPALESYAGKHLIVTDGTTLLGADDKAGIAEILSAVEYLVAHPEIERRPLSVAFTPDEEIGQGADHFDVAGFGASYAYTVDGEALGEVECENFNAASAHVTVKGINIHPGSAKGKMKNAVLMGHEFLSMLPPTETPAHTEGYEGFFHVTDFAGDESEARISLLVRDHDRARFEERKALLVSICERLEAVWGKGSFQLSLRDSYYNMKEIMDLYPEVTERALLAMKKEGVEPRLKPIRGGTDGARLSFMGLPCPNLSTGGDNYHSVHEYICVEDMEKMRDVLVRLVRAE